MIADKCILPRRNWNDTVLHIHQAGFQLAIHGVQTQMVDAIICAYEYLQSVTPDFALGGTD